MYDSFAGMMNDEKRSSLFKELKAKMGFGEGHGDEEEQENNDHRGNKMRGNKNAKKERRNIILGWMHNGTTVRTCNGGGARRIEVPNKALKPELVDIGKATFSFGLEQKGNLNDLQFDILDYSRCSMPDNTSVDEIYRSLKLSGYLRFYLASATLGAPATAALGVPATDSL